MVAIDFGLIHEAAQVLLSGGLVVFPTETVYGLGALAGDASAVARLYRVKGRPATNPLIVHVASIDAARELAGEGWNPWAEALAQRFWPGPLTLVLPRAFGLADAVTAGGPTMAVRVPDHPVALALLQACGKPVVAPSANTSGRLSPTLAAHVEQDLGDSVDLILDGGPCRAGVESTVIDLTVNPPRVLRPGPIAPALLEAVLGGLATGPGNETIARSPGLETRHYAPLTPMMSFGDYREAVQHVAISKAKGHSVLLIVFEDRQADIVLSAIPSMAESALYAALHRADAGRPDLIVVVLPPDQPDWWAVRDRLKRASRGMDLLQA